MNGLIPSLSIMTMGPKYRQVMNMKMREQHMVLPRRDLNLNKCRGVMIKSYLFPAPPSSSYKTDRMCSQDTMLADLLILPTLFRDYRHAFKGFFVSRNLGVSSRQNISKRSSMTQGIPQNKMLIILHFRKIQQTTPMKTPEKPKAISRATEYVCLLQQSTISPKMAMLIRMQDSQPAPAKNNPKQAVVIFCATQSSRTPKVVTPQAATMEIFLPKLSVMKRKIMQPLKVPMYRTILSTFSSSFFSQRQGPNYVASDSTKGSFKYSSHSCGFLAQILAQHCLTSSAVPPQLKLGSIKRKEVPSRRVPAINQFKQKMRKTTVWQRPLLPTIYIRLKQVLG